MTYRRKLCARVCARLLRPNHSCDFYEVLYKRYQGESYCLANGSNSSWQQNSTFTDNTHGAEYCISPAWKCILLVERKSSIQIFANHLYRDNFLAWAYNMWDTLLLSSLSPKSADQRLKHGFGLERDLHNFIYLCGVDSRNWS